MDGYLRKREEKRDMLRQENKLLFLLLFCLLFSQSCSKYKTYDTKKINNERKTVVTISQSMIGENEYKNVYIQMNDSVHSWIKNKLGWYKYYDGQRELVIDSVFCVNKRTDKLIASILKRCLDDCVQDNIEYFYGVRIKQQWYFFEGPNLTLPREYYQEDIHTPLSFAKLQQIATAHIYRGYLKQGKKGQWEINERFFDQIIPSKRTLEIYNLKDEEEYVKFMVEINWSPDIAATFKKYREN